MTARLTAYDSLIKIGYTLISECYEKVFRGSLKKLKIINKALQWMPFGGQNVVKGWVKQLINTAANIIVNKVVPSLGKACHKTTLDNSREEVPKLKAWELN